MLGNGAPFRALRGLDKPLWVNEEDARRYAQRL
jgi:hypothetical protein